MIERSALENAWNNINSKFPFDNYIPLARKESYFEMPLSVSKYLESGAKILDFGAGSCDKTAMLSSCGYDVVAFDDFGDDWYNFPGNKDKILNFAKEFDIEYKQSQGRLEDLFEKCSFDGIVLNNVIEHFHDSPGDLMNELLDFLKPNGFIFVAVPNAVNLRKRIDVLFGKTNYPPFAYYFWQRPWRGHIREYVKNDLIELNRFLGLDSVEISTHHYHLDQLKPWNQKIFKSLCRVFPGLRESWLYVGQRSENWVPKNSPNDEEFNQAFGKQYFNYKKNQIFS